MKNYWLERIVEENKKDLHSANTDYYGIEALAESYFYPLFPHDDRSIRRIGDKLADALYTLADKVLKYAWSKWLNSNNIEDFRQELITICFEKAQLFNPKTGQASNYFTTVMLEAMRDWHRRFNRTETFHMGVVDLDESLLCEVNENLHITSGGM